MREIALFLSPNHYKVTVLILWLFCMLGVSAQTTFTESANTYNLDIGGNKDGGHAWADYDLDGDFDLIINTVGRGYLMRNDGGSFSDQTATLAPDFFIGTLERTALFVDFNNDGYPDIFRNDHNNIKIYLQDPATNRFGNGTGGTVPNQHITSLTDGMNTEGAGALDFDGDGDLDLYIDNHNFGIDILLNDGTGNFTHVTREIDSPNPPYNVADPTTWPLGLVQDAIDGDYGSATDFNNDGWVDIVVRKRDQVDLFTNLGGTFQNGVDIDQATNANKGAVGFYDFDNDGDFDLYWTENGINQIHQNNGDGTWTGLGAGTGIPINFPGEIEGLACGDVDNDGDIDIFLTGNTTSRLYLNQINDGGGAMSFVDSGLIFNNNNGEGCTFIDIDNDGDLDLYTNRAGANRLYINDLPVAARADHLYINIIENRDEFGLIIAEQRFGIGATVTILDCAGNVISGIREVNGGSGHGTQESGVIHFGLPSGPNTPIVLEISYPRTSSGRVVVRGELIPFDFNDGSINIITVLPTTGNQAPIANDDIIFTDENNSVTFDPLVNNGNGVDNDPDGNPFAIISITQPANGTAILNGDGTITYTPDPGFFGDDPFTYTLEDMTSCTQVNQQGIGNVIMTVNRDIDNDNDGIVDLDDLDDDNDGIPDLIESCESNTFSNGNGGGIHPFNYMNAIEAVINIDFVDNSLQVNVDGTTIHANILQLESTSFSPGDVQMVFLSDGTQISSPGAVNINGLPRIQVIIDLTGAVIVRGTRSTASTSLEIMIPDDGSSFETVNFPVGVTTITVTNPDDDGSDGISGIVSIQCDTDGDGIMNSLDLDSDNDGIYDVVEAGHDQPHTSGVINGIYGANGLGNVVETTPESGIINYIIIDSDSTNPADYLDTDSDDDGCSDANEAYNNSDADGGDNEYFGTGNPPATDAQGRVTAATYPVPADMDSNSTYDYREAGVAPLITVQPVDTTVCPGCNTAISVVASNADMYQWQLFNGTIWVDITDSGIHSGTTTNILSITNASISDDGNQYRVIISHSTYVCIETSNAVTLTVRVNTVITNRRITYRVNKN